MLLTYLPHLKLCEMYVNKIKSYREVLLASDILNQQLRCLLATANLRQLNGFCQILYNAYDTNAFQLSKKMYRKLTKHTRILKVLCNSSKYTYGRRLHIMRKHLTIFINILKLLRPMIKKMLNDNRTKC